MISLKHQLEEFAKKSHNTGEDLNCAFKQLAPYFISGGYIKVREDYRVYPTTIEFYFHSEKSGGVKDFIVYHRNNKYVNGAIPYFPMFTLHAHDSGYDITFENPKEEYRASVLIRAYQIWDVKQKCWLKWGKSTNNDDSSAGKMQFLPYKGSAPANTQVLYLKYILNSFTMGSGSLIDWVDAEEIEKDPILNQRKNVPLYRISMSGEEKVEKQHFKEDEFVDQFKNPFKDGQVIEPKYFTYQKKCYVNDPRLWSFSRKEPVQKPI